MREIEILGPAGSKEGIYAALNAGADAVYVGTSRFGARAFAKNPSVEELEEALKEAVCHQKVTDMTENEKYQEIKRNVFDETQNAASPRMVQDIKDILKIR